MVGEVGGDGGGDRGRLGEDRGVGMMEGRVVVGREEGRTSKVKLEGREPSLDCNSKFSF